MSAARLPLLRRAAGALAAGLLVGAASCGPSAPREPQLHYMSTNYYFTISSDPMPPRAREPVLYKIYVRDKKTRQPLETGEGRIYSSNRDLAKTWDGLTKGPELGTYYGKLNFVTSGDWAIAVEFRRDSTSRMEKIEWMQDVGGAREQGTR